MSERQRNFRWTEKPPYNPVASYGRHGLAIIRIPVEVGTLYVAPIDISQFPALQFAWLRCRPSHIEVLLSSGKQLPPKRDSVVQITDSSLERLEIDFSTYSIPGKRNTVPYRAGIKI